MTQSARAVFLSYASHDAQAAQRIWGSLRVTACGATAPIRGPIFGTRRHPAGPDPLLPVGTVRFTACQSR
jgi:hypothetical protein